MLNDVNDEILKNTCEKILITTLYNYKLKKSKFPMIKECFFHRLNVIQLSVVLLAAELKEEKSLIYFCLFELKSFTESTILPRMEDLTLGLV